MNQIIEILMVTAYVIPATVLVLFGFNLYFMLVLFGRRRGQAKAEVQRIMGEFDKQGAIDRLPAVVTQIPIYNELNVVERVLRAAVAMDYPKGLHTVQVLDDSNDETCCVIDQVAAELQREGHLIEVIRRDNRVGFKAGALNLGLEKTDAELIAIFDADFVPSKDFLLQTVPVLMMRQDVGLVQARWGHLNSNHSLITRAQGVGIDGHFAIEQSARAWNNLFMNFNGTAGMWRRQAIEDAGGWEHDTLTEDMDLSYRAQLAGWAPFYLSDLVVPAELPESINAFKSQQFRWAKGSIQTALKLLPRVMRSDASWLAKVQSVFHMTHYIIHPIMVWLAFLALPLLLFTEISQSPWLVFVLFTCIILSALSPLSLYATSQMILYPKGWRRLRYLPILSCIGVGIAISNSRAVIEALLGKDSPFVRTPKKGDATRIHYRVKMPYVAILEVILGVYCFVSLAYYFHAKTYVIGPFLLLYAMGFFAVGCLSIAHTFQERRSNSVSAPLPEADPVPGI